MEPNDILLTSITRSGPHPYTAAAIDAARLKYGFKWMHKWGTSDLVCGRSELFQRALIEKPKVIFSIDGDMKFTADQVMQIVDDLSVEKKIGEVCAPYMKRNVPELSFRHAGPLDSTLGRGGSLVSISGAPLGFTAILTEALMAAREYTPIVKLGEKETPLWCMPMAYKGVYYSEDYALSRRIRQAGWDVCVDLSCEVQHLYEHAFGYHDTLAVTAPNKVSRLYGESYALRIASQPQHELEVLRHDTERDEV